jgi:5-methylcytosine-specific restriction endonuclease McrA
MSKKLNSKFSAFTLEDCKADAARFATNSEWYKNSLGIYNLATRKGWLDECRAHMHVQWRDAASLEECKASAVAFKGRHEWRAGAQYFYNRACSQGWLEECCAHMRAPRCSGRPQPVVVWGVSYPSRAAAFSSNGVKDAGSNVERRMEKDKCSLGEAIERCIDGAKAKIKRDKMLAIMATERAEKKAALDLQRAAKNAAMAEKKAATAAKKAIMAATAAERKRKSAAKQRAKLKAAGKKDNSRHIKRAKKRGVDYEVGITAKSVAMRFGMICQVCLRKTEPHKGKGLQPLGWTVGHIVAIANGGPHTWGNVQLECSECNSKKGTKTFGQVSFDLFGTKKVA